MNQIAIFHPSWIEPALYQAAQLIVSRLQAQDHTAYFAGGCVRDTLLRRPVQDIDIATDARPAQIEALFDDFTPVGAHFGVMLVREQGFQFEVATFRTDLGYSDGRHPDDIIFSCPREDARRRDFTINGLFYDPLEQRLIDHVGGVNDLKHGIVRAIGDPAVRFREDHLRLLRGIRFAAALDFDIEKSTWTAMVREAPSLSRIARERITTELVRMLTLPGAQTALTLLAKSGILEEILPEINALRGVLQPARFHPEGDVFTHTRLMFELASYPLSESLAMAILLHDIGKPATFRLRERIRFDGHPEYGARLARTILRRMKFSRDTAQLVEKLVNDHLRFMNVPDMRPATLKRFLRQEHFDLHLELHRLDCLASHRDLRHYDFCRRKLREFGRERLAPPPLLNGNDLIRLGLKPGPRFAVILADVESQQLDNALSSREEALRYVREKYIDPI
ncbi:MAG: CCA tRNA nucleotidyltransferase [Acidobacteria bacterium]|nr:CCA tRNA nucleotidyltransferase [Acidobacteriota bacterium]